MNRQKLKLILKKNELRHAGVVCTAKGFAVRGLSYRGDRVIPYDAVRMVAIALYGHGYSVEVNQREQAGVTHYSMRVDRIT